MLVRWRPYRVECTGSLPTSEVKRRRARLVLGWGTAREDLRVPPAFATPTLLRPQPATTLARLQPAARRDAQQAPPESPEQQAQDQARPQPNATWSGRQGRTRAHIAQHMRVQRARTRTQTHTHARAHTHTLVGPWARMTFLRVCTFTISVARLDFGPKDFGFKSCRWPGAARGGKQMWRRCGGSEGFK